MRRVTKCIYEHQAYKPVIMIATWFVRHNITCWAPWPNARLQYFDITVISWELHGHWSIFGCVNEQPHSYICINALSPTRLANDPSIINPPRLHMHVPAEVQGIMSWEQKWTLIKERCLILACHDRLYTCSYVSWRWEKAGFWLVSFADVGLRSRGAKMRRRARKY